MLTMMLALVLQGHPLTATAGLRPHNVVATPATLQGKQGLKVVATADAGGAATERLLIINELEFGDGVIEAETCRRGRCRAPEGARGFVGIAFRVQEDLRTYDAFYLRPTNGRADDQVRRNHAVQYHLTPGMDLVEAPPGVSEEVRVVRRSRARNVDEGED